MDSKNDKIKICIIGGGISGCSVSFFLKETFGDNADITLFEKTDTIGGRLATIDCDNRTFEVGGSILHSSNLYMKSFLKICGLEKKDDDKSSDEYVGFYDSEKILFEQNGDYFGICDKLRSFRYFGFFQLIKLTRWVDYLVNDFAKIYKLQDNGFTFTSLKEFLTKLNPSLYDISQTSLRSVLEKKRFNKSIINEIASVACLSNYGQSVDVNGFVGVISLAGTVGELWAVKGGNKQVPIKLLEEKTELNVIKNALVKYVGKDKENPDFKNVIIYQKDGQEIYDNSFDYVILSFPIHNKIENFNLDFDSYNSLVSNHQMQLTNTYILNGKLKLFPNVPANKRAQLHGVDKDVAYRCVTVQLPVDYNKNKDSKLYVKDGNKIYKIFSDKYLDSNTFDKIFESDYKLITTIPWLAYPKYEENPVSNSIPDIIVDSAERSRVYYSNALEWTSSCMEISCIESRNVSLLISKKEQNLVNPKKKKFFQNPILKDKTYEKFLHKLSGSVTLFSLTGFLIAVIIRVCF